MASIQADKVKTSKSYKDPTCIPDPTRLLPVSLVLQGSYLYPWSYKAPTFIPRPTRILHVSLVQQGS